MCYPIVSVLIIESHPLMREALASAIAAEPGWIVAAQVAAEAEAEPIATALKPDMILMALGNPGLSESAYTVCFATGAARHAHHRFDN